MNPPVHAHTFSIPPGAFEKAFLFVTLDTSFPQVFSLTLHFHSLSSLHPFVHLDPDSASPVGSVSTPCRCALSPLSLSRLTFSWISRLSHVTTSLVLLAHPASENSCLSAHANSPASTPNTPQCTPTWLFPKEPPKLVFQG